VLCRVVVAAAGNGLSVFDEDRDGHASRGALPGQKKWNG
jgi:hypothetical protein